MNIKNINLVFEKYEGFNINELKNFIIKDLEIAGFRSDNFRYIENYREESNQFFSISWDKLYFDIFIKDDLFKNPFYTGNGWFQQLYGTISIIRHEKYDKFSQPSINLDELIFEWIIQL